MLEHNYLLSQSGQTIGVVGSSELWRSKWAVTCYKLDLKKCYGNTEWIYSGYSTHLHNVLASEKKSSASMPNKWQENRGGVRKCGLLCEVAVVY